MFAYCNNNPVTRFDPTGYDYGYSARKMINYSEVTHTYGGLYVAHPGWADYLERHNNDTSWEHSFLDVGQPTFFSITNEGIEALSSDISLYTGTYYLSKDKDRAFYVSTGALGTYAGAHLEKGLGVEAGVSAVSLGYDGRFIDFNVDFLSLGATYMYNNGKFKGGISSGYIGFGVAVDIPELIRLIWGR